MPPPQIINSFLVFLKERLEEVLPCRLLSIYEAFGLTGAQAQIALDRTLVIRISQELLRDIIYAQANDYLGGQLSWQEKLKIIVDPYRFTVWQLDNLLIVNLTTADSPASTQEDADLLGELLGPYFPDLIRSNSLNIHLESGRRIRLRTWNPLVMDQIKATLLGYVGWFRDHADRITPRFEQIKEEINTYLTNNYGSISPSRHGFVQWFISNKLGKTTLELEIQPILGYGPDDFTIIDGKVESTTAELQPYVIERHLHEYCDWKLQKQQAIRQDIQQVNILNKPTVSFPTASIIEPMTEERMRELVREILKPLSQYNPQGKKIMTDFDYNRLLEYTEHLVLTDTLPAVDEPISSIDISGDHIRYTFYRLHKQLFTTNKLRPNFFHFLRLVFRQLEDQKYETLHRKFKTMPKSYERDFNIFS